VAFVTLLSSLFFSQPCRHLQEISAKFMIVLTRKSSFSHTSIVSMH